MHRPVTQCDASTETLIHRARRLLMFMPSKQACEVLVATGVDVGEAFNAIKAAELLPPLKAST